MRMRVMLTAAAFFSASFACAQTPPGPVPGTRLTESYVRQVAQSAHAWGWPMMNIKARFVAYSKLPSAGLAGGVRARGQRGVLPTCGIPRS